MATGPFCAAMSNGSPSRSLPQLLDTNGGDATITSSSSPSRRRRGRDDGGASSSPSSTVVDVVSVLFDDI